MARDPIRRISPVTSGLQRLYRLLATHPSAVKAAVLLRNQLDFVINYRFSETYWSADDADKLLLKLIGPTIRTFVDVGANIGNWTASLLSFAPSARLGVLVEPGVVAHSKLLDRFRAEPRVRLSSVALAERDGFISFFEQPGGGELSTAVESHRPAGAVPRRVQALALDTLLAQQSLDEVDIVKIDAEGLDLEILKGASDGLRRRAFRWVQFEYNEHWRSQGATLACAVQLLRANGYETMLLDRSGLHLAKLRRYKEYFIYSNYLACRTEDLPILEPMLLDDM
jgi:FkbM family methyltransferase